jgi:hypothetical protein
MEDEPSFRSDLVVVAPVDRVDRLLKCGFEPYGRCNQYTSTLVKSYFHQKNAEMDAKVLPRDCVWAIETVRLKD